MMEADEDCQEDQDEDVVADGEVNQDVVNKSIGIGEQDEETGDIAFEGPSSDLELTGEDEPSSVAVKDSLQVYVDMDDLD
jgi:hypothetical protein